MSRKLTPDVRPRSSSAAASPGLYGALCAAAEARVLLVSKGPVLTSSSWLAQGGIAAATAPGDAPELHAADTLARRARPLPRERGARADERGAGAHRRSRRPRRPRSTTSSASRAAIRGGASHSVGGAQTGREISRVLAPRGARASAHRRQRARARARAVDRRTDAVSALVTDARSIRRACGAARDRRLRGALGPHDESGRLGGRGDRDGVSRRRRGRGSRVRAVPSDGARGLVAAPVRGAARRRRAARGRARRPLRRGARAARRRRACDRRARHSAARPASDRPLALSRR